MRVQWKSLSDIFNEANEIKHNPAANWPDNIFVSCFPDILVCEPQLKLVSFVEDIDNNIYRVVTIGDQTWMAENLRSTRLNDGTPIPLLADNTLWDKINYPAYCWYENDSTTYGSIYGALYNHYATETGNVCPSGWKVPSKEDWERLITFLGGNEKAGKKLRETGTAHWIENTEATNESGFTALPGGIQWGFQFDYIGEEGYWWSSTDQYGSTFYFFAIDGYSSRISATEPYVGEYIRCIKEISQ